MRSTNSPPAAVGRARRTGSGLAALLIGAALVAALPAPSQARYACAVLRTADGFVALREGPSARHKIVARMKPQELVLLLHPGRDDIVRSGDWLYVRWYPGTRRTADHTPKADESTVRVGWVRDRLLNCFEE